LRVRINKVVERLARRRGIEADVAAGRELHAIVVVGPEKVAFLVRMLPCFGGIHGNPSVRLQIKLRPAVITGNGSSMLVGREREPDFETRWNSRGSEHANEKGVEIGAVAAFGRARPNRIAVAPARAGFVIAHSSFHVVVDGSGFCERLLDPFGLLGGEIGNHSLNRHQAIRLKEAWEFGGTWRGRICDVLINDKPSAMLTTRNLKTHENL